MAHVILLGKCSQCASNKGVFHFFIDVAFKKCDRMLFKMIELLFKSPITLLIFVTNLSIIERRVLKVYIIVIDSSISLFSSISFCPMYFIRYINI